MNKPIKRIWVPPQAPAKALQGVAGAPTAPATAVNAPLQGTPDKRNMLFDQLPEPEMEEKDSDSIWAEFGSVLGPRHLPK
jgi:hypothetical protein